jgi:hypothetical protein
MFSTSVIEFATPELKTEIENNKTHYTAICLIIASHSVVYDKMANLWRKYMSINPNIKSYFLYCEPNIEADIFITHDKIIYKHEENLAPGILLKTFAGIHVANTYFSYDFLIRPNISSIFHFDRVIHFLKKQPTTKFVYSSPSYFSFAAYDKHKHISGSNELKTYIKNTIPPENYDKQFYFYGINYKSMHGAGYIFSKDIGEQLLQNIKDTPIHEEVLKIVDDRAITILINMFHKYDNILYTDKHIYVPFNKNEPKQLENKNIFHFRNQHSGFDGENRTIDLSLMTEQIEKFYGI